MASERSPAKTRKTAKKSKAASARSSKRTVRGQRRSSAAKSAASEPGRAKRAAKRTKPLRKGPETEVTDEVLEFIRALDEFKRTRNRPFPTWSEVLEVLKGLGYRKV